MTTDALFHESIDDALREVVSAAGGFKKVAALLKPDRSPEAASRWLHDCFNESKPERLTPTQIMFLLRLGRQIGAHGAINYINRESGYHDARPLDPVDESAALQRAFMESVQVQKSILARMEKIGQPAPLAVVGGGK